MTDQELLELAAKASGYVEIVINEKGYVLGFVDTNKMELWNPLTGDGDALRLAVQLNLVELAGATAWVDFYFNNDPFEAARRAIVCAAAELGKATL